MENNGAAQEGVDYAYHRDLITESDDLFKQLDELPDWQRRPIRVAGRDCRQQRYTCFYAAHPGVNYRYSGIDNVTSGEMPPAVWEIQRLVEEATGHTYNYCLLNKYQGGRDHICWHSDDERGMCLDVGVASVSLGQERRFDIRRRDNHRVKTSLTLENGSLLWMGPQFQKIFQHQIPPQRRLSGTRINLTFRKIQ